jgi:CO dehydrogenase/acetyl-CoA synthase beta subunit
MQENGIAKDSLPDEIKEAIAELEKLGFDLDELDEVEDDTEIVELKNQIAELDGEISEMIVEHVDDEEEDEETDQERQERIVAEIYFSATVVAPKTLMSAGIPLPTSSKWSKTIGSYTLSKQRFDTSITITKTS